MAEDTSLFQEIDEAIRADKLEDLWKRYSGAIIGFCVLAVLSSAVSVWWKNHVHEANARETGLLVQAGMLDNDGKYAEAIGLYEQAEELGGKLGVLAAVKHAEALIALKQNDKALSLYNEIADGKKGHAPDLQDYAKIQAGILAGNKAADAAQADKPDMKGAFAPMGKELTAVRALESGDSKTAKPLLTDLVNDDATPASQRARAGLFLQSIEGSGK